MPREKIGTVTNYDEDNSKVEIELIGDLSNGDRVALLGPVAYNPVEVKGIKESSEGDRVTLSVEESVREGTTVYKMTN